MATTKKLARPKNEGKAAQAADGIMMRRVEVECMAETLTEQMDLLISISDGLLQEADEAMTALSILSQLKIKRDLLRDALDGNGCLLIGLVQP